MAVHAKHFAHVLCREARPSDGGDMRRHGDVSIEVDAKIPNRGDWQDRRVAGSNWVGRDLVLTTFDQMQQLWTKP